MEKELALLCKTEKEQKLINFKVLKTIGNQIPLVTEIHGKSLEESLFIPRKKF